MSVRQAVVIILAMTSMMGARSQSIISQTSLLRDGDLLFQAPPSDNPITRSTGYGHTIAFDHVGIFHIDGEKPMVLEANYDGVVDTPFEQFVKGGKQVFVGRVKGADLRQSIDNARRFLGRPYDFVFSDGNDAIYCSELVEKSYVDKRGKQLFTTIPMSFHDQTGEILPFWEDFYARRLMTVPEGLPGTNPMELSTRKCVKIKYQWCRIDK
jgi:uncharacterized protein YycO